MTDKQFDLTLISISYNNFESIKTHVESIMNQDYENYELIFQDDGSDNYDSNMIRNMMPVEYREKHNVRFYHNKKNQGTVKNINIGVSHSSGKVIMPMAADDYLSNENVFTKFMEEFADDSCNVCTCSVIQEKSHIIGPNSRDADLIKNGTRRELLDRIYASNCISGALLTFRKDFFLKKGLFDTRFVLVEDYPTFLRLIQEGERIRFIEDVCLIHGEDGISTSRFATLFNRNKLLTKDAKLIKDLYVMPNLREVKNRTIRRFIIACYYLRYHKNKIQLIAMVIRYADIWIKVAMFYAFHSKNSDGLYYYLLEN